MKTQIKRIGSCSKGIIIAKENLKFLDLDIDDWVDYSDLIKISKPINTKKEGVR